MYIDEQIAGYIKQALEALNSIEDIDACYLKVQLMSSNGDVIGDFADEGGAFVLLPLS